MGEQMYVLPCGLCIMILRVTWQISRMLYVSYESKLVSGVTDTDEAKVIGDTKTFSYIIQDGSGVLGYSSMTIWQCVWIS